MQLSRYERAGFNGAIALRRRLDHTGQTASGQWCWTEAEVATLRALYPDYGALVRALPRRTRKAIERKAAKLGVARRLLVWTAAEVGHFKAPYIGGVGVSEIAASLVRKAPVQVYAKAAKKRYRRPRRRPILLGEPLKDSIRQRAFEMNISLAELERDTRARGCFGRSGRLRWDAVARALKILGGRAVVRWPAA